MAQGKDHASPGASPAGEAPDATNDARKRVTRRDFLIRGNASAVTVGLMAGTGFATSALAQRRAEVAPADTPSARGAGVTTRRVTLDLDGRKQEVKVDVRESLFETLNYQLGLANCNLGCDRAQCGACTVVVDSRAVNGCTLLTARLGRGQKIVTVAGISTGPGVAGLHPVQRAFWLEGGFQCGICTRGFVMASYALLEKNRNPTNDEIKEALSGNICRCGEYPKIMSAVRKAAAQMRGEQVTYAAPLAAEVVAVDAAASGSASRQFEFATALGTIEEFDELALELKQRPGILGVAGTERTVTVTWDPARLDEARVRQLLAESGHGVRP